MRTSALVQPFMLQDIRLTTWLYLFEKTRLFLQRIGTLNTATIFCVLCIYLLFFHSFSQLFNNLLVLFFIRSSIDFWKEVFCFVCQYLPLRLIILLDIKKKITDTPTPFHAHENRHALTYFCKHMSFIIQFLITTNIKSNSTVICQINNQFNR